MDGTEVNCSTKRTQVLTLTDLMDTYAKGRRKAADIQANILRVRENLERLTEAQAELQDKIDRMQALLMVLTPEERKFVQARMEHASLSRRDMCKRLKMPQAKTDALWKSALRKMVVALDHRIGERKK